MEGTSSEKGLSAFFERMVCLEFVYEEALLLSYFFFNFHGGSMIYNKLIVKYSNTTGFPLPPASNLINLYPTPKCICYKEAAGEEIK